MEPDTITVANKVKNGMKLKKAKLFIPGKDVPRKVIKDLKTIIIEITSLEDIEKPTVILKVKAILFSKRYIKTKKNDNKKWEYQPATMKNRFVVYLTKDPSIIEKNPDKNLPNQNIEFVYALCIHYW